MIKAGIIGGAAKDDSFIMNKHFCIVCKHSKDCEVELPKIMIRPII